MSAGAGGSRQKSRSSSKPTLLPEQKEIWQYFGTDVIPAARGQETALTRQLEQTSRDEAARLQSQSMTGLMDLASKANIGAAQLGSLQAQTQEDLLQQTLRNIQAQRAQVAQQSLNMISGMPIQPGQSSKAKSSAWSASAKVSGTGQ